jgi:predicted 3-demethylubiquinone-9 3-methyltransferase (glyoxalase superfamily)
MQKISPCLWFKDNAEEAAHFYTNLFKDSRIVSDMRFGDAGPGSKGAVMAVTFELEGQEFMALNGGTAFTFSPAISLFIKCGTQEEVDRLWAGLGEGGAPRQCGWISDKYGVTWQIVPTALGTMLQDKDAAKSARVMQAMMGMVKLDIAALERAYRGP